MEGGGGYGSGGGGGGRSCTYRYTVTTRMTPASRWAAMRAIFNISLIMRDKVTRPQRLKRKESRSGFESRSFRLPAQRLTARPNWLTCSASLLGEN